MKFKPILGSDLSGHIGGVVASHNTYGPYFRQRVRPVNRKTPAQQAQRAAIAAVSQQWRALTDTVRASWISASVTKTSRKGDRVVLTGAAAYQFVNTIRQRIGVPIVTVPPTSVGPADLTTPSLSLTDAVTASVTFANDAWNATQGGVIVSGALLTSSGKSFASPSNAVTSLVNPGGSPVSVPLPFAVPIGARARLSFHATNPDGRVSTYQSLDVLNSSFVPPTPSVQVISVTNNSSASQAIWSFTGRLSSVDAANLFIQGVGGTSFFQVGNDVIVNYLAAPVTGNTWTVNVPNTNAPPIVAPLTGTVL
jgi:hypothetical protein